MANYVKIKTYDIANGVGIRTSIFFAGCDLHCKGCFNQETWDFKKGEEFTKDVYDTKISQTMNSHVAGISILGGEPLHINNQEGVYDLVLWFRMEHPDKTIWLWTGYEIFTKPQQELLNLCDVAVVGPFVESEKDITIPFRGSRNQKILVRQKDGTWYNPTDDEVQEGIVFTR